MTSTRADIAFLHTASVHVGTFNALAAELAPQLTLTHSVREDLLSAAEKAGLVTPAIDLMTQEALLALAENARVVVCTCSTLGASAEALDDETSVPVLRIDRAMADLAVKTGRRIGVAACAPTTVPNTQTLIRSSAARAKREIAIRTFVFDDVWNLFREGRLTDYYEGIATRLVDAARNVDVIVLAQASMAPAALMCGDLKIPVLSSPRIGFEAAVQALAVAE
ncbi:MAG: aspartate/glutamate racemase family protein [Parvibaculum sp.]|nr:aspartate/glutamate racemase family protein [Parvibaculum sp.]